NLPIPVIIVGAQRSSDRPSSDAATNLIGAVKAAAYGPFAEVVIAMHETVADTTISLNRGCKVRKCHTSRRDTFKPINTSTFAQVTTHGIKMLTNDYQKRDPNKKLLIKANFDVNVALIKFFPGFDPSLIQYYTQRKVKAILLEGTGLGHISRGCFKQIQDAIENHNLIIALSSQCIWGRVNMNVYDTGRDLLKLGVIPTDDMFPETALVKLMWSLGQTQNIEEAKQLFKTNTVGELTSRTLPQETQIHEGDQ
ncbi:MAG: Glu-tRNA(Gln) amidotransferase subunit GatD, partial [Crenarchaeota archaeon]|nr:Glu-tRNA(Gln) amidotransferase subunit GatD [Thermoproteota archaeon]